MRTCVACDPSSMVVKGQSTTSPRRQSSRILRGKAPSATILYLLYALCAIMVLVVHYDDETLRFGTQAAELVKKCYEWWKQVLRYSILNIKYKFFLVSSTVSLGFEDFVVCLASFFLCIFICYDPFRLKVFIYFLEFCCIII